MKRRSSWLQVENNSEHSVSEKRVHDSWEGLGKELASYSYSDMSTVSLFAFRVKVTRCSGYEGVFLRVHLQRVMTTSKSVLANFTYV